MFILREKCFIVHVTTVLNKNGWRTDDSHVKQLWYWWPPNTLVESAVLWLYRINCQRTRTIRDIGTESACWVECHAPTIVINVSLRVVPPTDVEIGGQLAVQDQCRIDISDNDTFIVTTTRNILDSDQSNYSSRIIFPILLP